MKVKKYIFFISLIVIFSIIGCFIFSKMKYKELINTVNDREDFIVFSNDEISIFIVPKEPAFAFGSGHKEVFLFSKNKFMIGKCVYGEFPISVESVDNENKKIYFEIDGFQDDYMNSWIKKNKRIGQYELIYRISS